MINIQNDSDKYFDPCWIYPHISAILLLNVLQVYLSIGQGQLCVCVCPTKTKKTTIIHEKVNIYTNSLSLKPAFCKKIITVWFIFMKIF